MSSFQDTGANEDGEFIFRVDENTPQQVIDAIDDFATFKDLFEVRSREYGNGSFFFLGSKGQFSDIYRKIIKLKTALWDGRPEQLTSEGTEEVIYDLIGHLFLTLQCMRKEGISAYQKEAGQIEEIKKLKLEERRQREAWTEQVRATGLYPVEESPCKPLGEILAESQAYGRLISDSKPVDARLYKYPVGARVRFCSGRTTNWHFGKTAIITEHDRASAGLWYKVIFEDETGEVTCSEEALELVPKLKPRKVKDNPQA